jgi:hypothetical protein
MGSIRGPRRSRKDDRGGLDGAQLPVAPHPGDVPGDPMPIANGPVTNPQMLALGCWIEGLPEDGPIDPHGAIDYQGCSFAEDPPLFVEPVLEDEGETD